MEPTASAAPAPAPSAVLDTAPKAASLAEIKAVAQRARLGADFVLAQMEAGATLDAVRDAAIDAVALARAPEVPISTVNARAVILRDERDTLAVRMAAGLALRAGLPLDAEDGAPAGIPVAQLEQAAREFRGLSLIDMARESLEANGIKTRGRSRMEIAEMALKPGTFRGDAGNHTTSDFPNLLANTASKSLRMGYNQTRQTFRVWAQQHDLPDFKSFNEVALGGAPALTAIKEDGEVTFGTVSEGKEAWNLVRYGKAVAVSYVALVNDDLSGFTRLPAMFGAAASRLESDTVYGVLTANANMADGAALFVAGHANYTTGAFGTTSVGTAVAALRKQTAPNGDILGLDPRFLIVPAALETTARALWTTVNPAGAGTTYVNPWGSVIEPVVEARLDATSTVAFYVIAAPNQIDTVHFGYLAGETGPRIASEIGFDTDGMKVKCVHNFGAKAIDWRGMVYSTGA